MNITVQIAELDQDPPPAPVSAPRRAWMSGRPVQAIVYIANFTTSAAEIPDPADPRSGRPEICFQRGQLADGSPDWRCGIEDNASGTAQLDVPSRTINPGETLVVARKSTELIGGTESFWLGEGGLPRTEGHYSLSYLGGAFEFDIVAPVPVSSVLVPVRAQRAYFDASGNGAIATAKMVIFSVLDNGWPTICWSIENVEDAVELPVGPQGRLLPSALNTLMPIGVYALPVAGPIVTLTATADASDRITIDYSGADGIHHLLALNAARRLPKAGDETISPPLSPNGPLTGVVNTPYSYTLGGAASSAGHPLEYSMDWGDGSYSDWMPAGAAPQTWTAAAFYPVSAQARCAVHRSLVSDPSAGVLVTIGGGSVPTIAEVNPPSGRAKLQFRGDDHRHELLPRGERYRDQFRHHVVERDGGQLDRDRGYADHRSERADGAGRVDGFQQRRNQRASWVYGDCWGADDYRRESEYGSTGNGRASDAYGNEFRRRSDRRGRRSVGQRRDSG